MKNKKTWFGALLMIIGIILGAYVGGWWAFVGGVMQIIAALQVVPVSAVGIGVGLLKVVSAGALGILTFYVFFIPGWVLLTTSYRR